MRGYASVIWDWNSTLLDDVDLSLGIVNELLSDPTLCHELAHLRYFNHGARFHGFYRKLLRWARDEGIYQPRLVTVRGHTPVPAPMEAPRGLAPPCQPEPPDPLPEDEPTTPPPTQLTLFD